ncbi:hypothetical protein WAC30_28805, partial [Klebsiella pneumoniae]|uniref:hypothetical protein n=1 Tax=Klebsiella pneumoniae TaxID=573 RepID=UPI003045CCDC
IEQKMFKGPWVMGDQFTICDPYLHTLSHWLEGDSVDINATPKIADHCTRLSDRPAGLKVLYAQKGCVCYCCWVGKGATRRAHHSTDYEK